MEVGVQTRQTIITPPLPLMILFFIMMVVDGKVQ